MSKFVTGTFYHPDGSPASGATLTLLISQDVAASGHCVIIHAPVLVTLDENGSIPYTPPSPGPESGTQVWANDEVLPNGTWYVVTVKDQDFGQVFYELLTISGESPIDLSTIPPGLK